MPQFLKLFCFMLSLILFHLHSLFTRTFLYMQIYTYVTNLKQYDKHNESAICRALNRTLCSGELRLRHAKKVAQLEFKSRLVYFPNLHFGILRNHQCYASSPRCCMTMNDVQRIRRVALASSHSQAENLGWRHKYGLE